MQSGTAGSGKKKDANEGLLWLDALIHRNPHALTLNASRPN
jgi:hypothetical protein